MAQQLKASQLKPAYQSALHPRQVILCFSNELRGEAPGQDLPQLFLHFFQPEWNSPGRSKLQLLIESVTEDIPSKATVTGYLMYQMLQKQHQKSRLVSSKSLEFDSILSSVSYYRISGNLLLKQRIFRKPPWYTCDPLTRKESHPQVPASILLLKSKKLYFQTHAKYFCSSCWSLRGRKSNTAVTRCAVTVTQLM